MSAFGLHLDSWLDENLRAVPLPDGLTARLRRIPGLVSGGVAIGPTLAPLHHSPLTTPPLTTQLDAALTAVPLPGGLVDRLQTTCGPMARRARWRDCMERTAVAALVLLAIGGSYAASLAAFLWISYPAARLAAGADQPRWFQGTFSSTEDLEGPTVRFDFSDADSPAARRVFNEAVAAAHIAEAGSAWQTGATDDPVDSEPILLASGDVDVAISEHLDRLWQQGHGLHGSRVLLSRVGPSDTDDDFEAMKVHFTRWFAVRWSEWPCLRELAGFLDRLSEPTDRRSEWEE
ncbi:MAG TPA: hypothetical protein VND64_27145 [Pirellulales bacterium]|nr:hypothetical protein [Pirellulales bacterium]